MKQIFQLAVVGVCGAALFAQGATPPPFAAAAGYTTNTFSSTFDPSQVDIENAGKPGYKWYRSRFFYSVTPVSGVVLNGDRTVTLENNNGANYGISSAGRDGKNGWVGTVFGGGGYFEATLKFDPQTVTNGKKGYPAWWSMAIEHMAALPSAHWPGQAAGYDHYIEPDFFEWDVPGYGNPPGKSYGGAMIDWSAIWPKAVRKMQPWPKFVVTTPSTTDFRQYHRFGWLWVPATATTQGYGQFCFDGQPSPDRVSWTQFTNQTPTPAKQTDPWTWGILDQQHLVLILGSGARGPMTVQSVNVWQKNDRQNGHDGIIPPFDTDETGGKK